MSNVMQQLKQSNILINSQFFDRRTIESFAKKNLPQLSLAEAKNIKPTAPSSAATTNRSDLKGDADLDHILQQVLAEAQVDPEMAKIAKQQAMQLKTEAKTRITNSFTSMPSVDLLKNNQDSLDIHKIEHENRIIYSINNEVIVEIPFSEKNSRLAVSLEMLLAWTFLIWHSVSFIATVASIWMPKATGGSVKGVSQVVNKSSSRWSRFVEAMKAIKEKVEASEKVKTFIAAFKCINVFKQLFVVVKAILSKLKWYEITLAVLEFVGTVALLFVTAGASLIVKMIKLAVNLVNIVQDVIKILKLEGKLTLISESETLVQAKRLHA